MRSLRIALFFSLVAAFSAATTVYAEGKSSVNHSGALTADAYGGYVLLAQAGAGGRNSCMSACQAKYKSCLAQIDPACNSRGCNNERNACNIQYDECGKSCPAN
jgi:hypothetical protein